MVIPPEVQLCIGVARVLVRFGEPVVLLVFRFKDDRGLGAVVEQKLELLYDIGVSLFFWVQWLPWYSSPIDDIFHKEKQRTGEKYKLSSCVVHSDRMVA